MATAVPTKTCPRCGGSGHYSYNPRYGTICFQCNGQGKVLDSKKAKVKVTSLFEYAEVGDVFQGANAGTSVVLEVLEGDFIKKVPSMFGGYDDMHYPQKVRFESLIDGKVYSKVRHTPKTERTDSDGVVWVVNKKTGVWKVKK